MKPTTRRSLLGALAGAGAVTAASAQSRPVKEVHHRPGREPKSTPLYNSAISLGNLVFLSGTGVAEPLDVGGQTDRVLKSLEERLILAGSSMEKVVKCNVYLQDLRDYDEMNKLFEAASGPSRRCAQRLPWQASRSKTARSKSRSLRIVKAALEARGTE